MSKMSELDSVLKELHDALAVVNAATETIIEIFSKNEDEEESRTKATKPLTLPEVRAILAEKSRAGFTAEIKELLLKHGADKLSAVAPSEYEALIAEAEELKDAT